MSGHTPGPWAVSAYLSSRPDQIRKNYVSAADGINGNWRLFVTEGPDAEANAARIVACVNACEGLADPSVVSELVTALECVTDDLEAEIEDRRGSVLQRTLDRDLEAVHQARAAIAKARGRA